MTRKTKTVFWTIVGIQFLILFTMNAVREYRLLAGTVFEGAVVRLKVVPVDPRDLLRGDYVNLRYDITSLPPNLIKDSVGFERRETVYVGLRKGAHKTWEAVAIYHRIPEEADGMVFIMGEALDDVREIRYGLESYYVPEGKGGRVEEAARKGDLTVNVAVDPAGHATILQLWIGDAPFGF